MIYFSRQNRGKISEKPHDGGGWRVVQRDEKCSNETLKLIVDILHFLSLINFPFSSVSVLFFIDIREVGAIYFRIVVFLNLHFS